MIGASLSWKAALIAASPPRRAGPDLGDPPPDAGPAYLWVVLRDSRGSVAFAGHAVGIAP